MSNLLAKLFGGLTQEGITLPNGDFESASQAQNVIPSMPDSGLDTPAQKSTVQKPSFAQASRTGPGGTPNALSPQLSTKGKILTTILQAAAGGLAAAGQKTVGGGFEAGSQLPFMQAQMRQQAQQGQLQNQMLQSQVQYAPMLRQLGIMKSQADIQHSQAETSKANAEVAGMPGKQRLEAAQAEAANYKDDPNMGLVDLRTGQPLNNAATAPLSPEEAQVLGKQPGERVPLKLKNQASEIAARGIATVNTNEGVYERNRLKGTMTRLGSNPRMVFAPENRIIQVADPNKPGETTFVKAGQAVKQGAAGPQSASVQVPKQVLKSEVPTKAGDLKVAFNTSIQHADLLRQAVKALNNGDNQTLAGLKNRFKNEFGNEGPVTAQAIADAYGREVTAMLAKGHMTDSEVSSVGRTINPSKQNYKTLDAVLGAYQALAKSKLKMLNNQEQDVVMRSQGGSQQQDNAATHVWTPGGGIVPVGQ